MCTCTVVPYKVNGECNLQPYYNILPKVDISVFDAVIGLVNATDMDLPQCLLRYSTVYGGGAI